MDMTFAMAGKIVGLSISTLVLLQAFVSCLGALNRARLTNKKAKLQGNLFLKELKGGCHLKGLCRMWSISWLVA